MQLPALELQMYADLARLRQDMGQMNGIVGNGMTLAGRAEQYSST